MSQQTAWREKGISPIVGHEVMWGQALFVLIGALLNAGSLPKRSGGSLPKILCGEGWITRGAAKGPKGLEPEDTCLR